MTQDHIKLRWLQEFLEGVEFMQQYQWVLYTDEDLSESCIVDGGGYEVDLEYDILLHIQEYTRPASELRRILQYWLDAANPQPIQQINIQYRQIDTSRTDLSVSIAVSETQRDLICDPEEAEGKVTLNGSKVHIKLDRQKPQSLQDLESIHCIGKHP